MMTGLSEHKERYEDDGAIDLSDWKTGFAELSGYSTRKGRVDSSVML
jgi:hypothetical protein